MKPNHLSDLRTIIEDLDAMGLQPDLEEPVAQRHPVRGVGHRQEDLGPGPLRRRGARGVEGSEGAPTVGG